MELILYNDLVVNRDGTSVGDEIGISDKDHIYKTAPKKCTECECNNVISLQVLGATNKGLLWVCDKCEKVYLKYTFRYTINKLKRSREFWTTPSSWEPPEDMKGFN